jgi:hypothetical protein
LRDPAEPCDCALLVELRVGGEASARWKLALDAQTVGFQKSLSCAPLIESKGTLIVPVGEIFTIGVSGSVGIGAIVRRAVAISVELTGCLMLSSWARIAGVRSPSP